MQVDIQKADITLKPILANLLELYLYDFTEVTPFEEAQDVDETGKFGYKYLDSYWVDPMRHPFIIRVNRKIAGFVFINLDYEEASEPNTHGIAEFFVMRKYRNKDIGKKVAFEIFDMFPGKWQVGQTKENFTSQDFWKKVINEYTNGNFVESESEKGPRQNFENQ